MDVPPIRILRRCNTSAEYELQQQLIRTTDHLKEILQVLGTCCMTSKMYQSTKVIIDHNVDITQVTK